MSAVLPASTAEPPSDTSSRWGGVSHLLHHRLCCSGKPSHQILQAPYAKSVNINFWDTPQINYLNRLLIFFFPWALCEHWKGRLPTNFLSSLINANVWGHLRRGALLAKICWQKKIFLGSLSHTVCRYSFMGSLLIRKELFDTVVFIFGNKYI